MVKIGDQHMDYYSSDEHFSDSGEESDHLNKLSPLQLVTPMNREATYMQPGHSGTHHGLSKNNNTCRKME